jgi:putative heme-binding domain-containing protein
MKNKSSGVVQTNRCATSSYMVRTLTQLVAAGLLFVSLSTSSSIAQDKAADASNTNGSRDPSSTADAKVASVLRLVKLTWKANPAAAAKSLMQIAELVENGDCEAEKVKALSQPLQERFNEALQSSDDPRHHAVACLSALCGNKSAAEACAKILRDEKASEEVRRLSGIILLKQDPKGFADYVRSHFQDKSQTASPWTIALAELGFSSDEKEINLLIVSSIPTLPAELAATVAERATQRKQSSLMMLQAVSEGLIAKDLLNSNQLQRLEKSEDPEIVALLRKTWGQIRVGNREDRAEAIKSANRTLKNSHGNPEKGWLVFSRVCGQCHLLHDKGYEVGPNLTQNGRSSFSQLLSNVLDPSLVIGTAYQAHTVLTVDGRVLTGLLTENSDEKIVLKIQGGKTETIPRDEIEEAKQSELSLMPEGLEKQMTAEELADLFALLTLEKPPGEADNRLIPETPEQLHRAPKAK